MRALGVLGVGGGKGGREAGVRLGSKVLGQGLGFDFRVAVGVWLFVYVCAFVFVVVWL